MIPFRGIVPFINKMQGSWREREQTRLQDEKDLGSGDFGKGFGRKRAFISFYFTYYKKYPKDVF